MKLSIVVPCYNEAKNIPLILERFNSVVKRPDIEIILVNNGSTDDSQEVLDSRISQYPFARIIKLPVNQGYGYGILEGLKVCRGEYIGWTHADMQTDPHDPIKALEWIEKEGSPREIYVKGLRKGRSFFDLMFTFGMSFFETIYLGHRLWDINAQPNIFHRSFFLKWKNPPHDFALDLYALYMAKHYHFSVYRFDVSFPPRIHGSSNWNTNLSGKWKFIRRTLSFSMCLKKTLASEQSHFL
jgi:glycosyltransferase involved in cell wall biosynthesis